MFYLDLFITYQLKLYILAYKKQLSVNQGRLALSLTSMSESARRSRASSSERRWPLPAKSSQYSEVEFLQSPSNLPSSKHIAILHEHIL